MKSSDGVFSPRDNPPQAYPDDASIGLSTLSDWKSFSTHFGCDWVLPSASGNSEKILCARMRGKFSIEYSAVWYMFLPARGVSRIAIDAPRDLMSLSVGINESPRASAFANSSVISCDRMGSLGVNVVDVGGRAGSSSRRLLVVLPSEGS